MYGEANGWMGCPTWCQVGSGASPGLSLACPRCQQVPPPTVKGSAGGLTRPMGTEGGVRQGALWGRHRYLPWGLGVQGALAGLASRHPPEERAADVQPSGLGRPLGCLRPRRPPTPALCWHQPWSHWVGTRVGQVPWGQPRARVSKGALKEGVGRWRGGDSFLQSTHSL